MNWTEIEIKTTPEAADILSEIMMEQGCHGTAITGKDPVTVTGHLATDHLVEDRILKIREGVERVRQTGIDLGEAVVVIQKVQDEDWTTAWRKFYKPLRIGKRFVIKPSWEEYSSKLDDLIIELDPGMAFGTGWHATTSLCLEALETYVKPGDTVLDVGCGTGILGIGALLLGAEKAVMVDNDSVAVQIAAENAKINHLGDKVAARHSDLVQAVSETGNILVSNIIANVVIQLAPSVPEHLQPGGYWISSGIIDTRREDVLEAIQKTGLRVLDVKARDEWIAVIAVKD